MLNKILKAILNALLFFAVVHLGILLYLTLTTGVIDHLNVFRILEINIFFPGIETGTKSQIISSAIVITAVLYFYFKKGKNN